MLGIISCRHYSHGGQMPYNRVTLVFISGILDSSSIRTDCRTLAAGQFFTGVYGMNFDYMPELHYKVWYIRTSKISEFQYHLVV